MLIESSTVLYANVFARLIMVIIRNRAADHAMGDCKAVLQSLPVQLVY